MFAQNTEVKASLAERAIKTIRMRMTRYFTQKQSYRYIDLLQDFAKSYNHTYHRSIKMKPVNVTPENQQQLWFRLYAEPLLEKPGKVPKPKLKVGDLVRLSYIRHAFSREYNSRWTGEIFKVSEISFLNRIPMYRVKDYHNKDIVGYFYLRELQKVSIDESQPYKIDKIIKTRKHKGVKQYYVSWLYWPSIFNTWINAADIEKV
jgi:hypothetical protein